MQAQNRNFYDEFGCRIRFLRKKRGLTLSELSGGKPSTAKSWEGGIKPRPDEWEAIANRLGVTVSFAFLGEPKSREDFDFVAKYADEIGYPPRPVMVVEEPESMLHGAVAKEKPQGEYGTTAQEATLRANVEQLIERAQRDPNRLGWLLEQMRVHLVAPAEERWPLPAAHSVASHGPEVTFPEVENPEFVEDPKAEAERTKRVEEIKKTLKPLPPFDPLSPKPATKLTPDHEKALRKAIEEDRKKHEHRTSHEASSSLKTQSGAGR